MVCIVRSVVCDVFSGVCSALGIHGRAANIPSGVDSGVWCVVCGVASGVGSAGSSVRSCL